MKCEKCERNEAVADAGISRYDSKKNKREFLTSNISLCRSCVRKACNALGLDFPSELEEEIPNIFND